MLKQVLIVSHSGIVVYRQEFEKILEHVSSSFYVLLDLSPILKLSNLSLKPTLMGSLLSTMTAFCLNSFQRPIEYIEMQNGKKELS